MALLELGAHVLQPLGTLLDQLGESRGAFLALDRRLLVGQLLSRSCGLLFVATSLLFFLMYEWLHLAYHIPADTWLGRNPLIAKLRARHQLHHDPRLMKRWNFNITVPLFDWLHGTLWSPERAARAAPLGRRPAAPIADR